MLALMLALAVPGPALAEWFPVTTSREGSVFSLDPDRIRTVGGKRHVWMKGDHSRNRGESSRSSMTLLSIDCASSTIKTLSDTRYDSYGKATSTRSYPDYGVGYDPITPESIADEVARRACAAGDPL
ncbi:hypothetical protein KZ813_16670 [Sphingomonas sp. RHCKR7]|uniref:surface-adhesin E family protein n=1 Tax=Sphingomonas folli TaxID=2862497 RepID=UPI001CA5476C|nr:surface-adhesin E family protein [Sphingomonas folli]MBW6528479.1 hypothetical protein [Sphingomonas folli]